MKLGTMVHLDENVVEKIKDVKKYGLESFQLCAWNFSFMTDEYVEKILAATKETGLEISAVWCGWSGEATVLATLDHLRRATRWSTLQNHDLGLAGLSPACSL